MKRFLLVVTFLMSFGAFAENNVAEGICADMTFDSDKMECLKVVRRGYIGDNAATMCEGMVFSSNILSCLSAATNKQYTSSEIATCNSMGFESNKIDCLKEGGRPARTYEDSREINAELRLMRIERLARRVKRQLYEGDVVGAIANMTRIIELATTEDRY